jgi:hypothetical protein
MKKILLIAGLALCVLAGIHAEQPDNLAFETGLGTLWDAGSGDNGTVVNYGFYSVFNEVIAGGFSLTDINYTGSRYTLGLVNVLAALTDNVNIRLSMGIAEPPPGAGLSDSPLIGLGLNYDELLTRESGFLFSLGIFADWIAVFDTDPAMPFRLEDGGALSIGLRVKIGV